MARLPDLARFCKRHGLLMVSVADLARYRLDTEPEEAIAFLDALHC
jgi:3,4-dihydroxy-2-butanone 4-phosphate synthase